MFLSPYYSNILFRGAQTGPCNMHTADYVKARKEVFVFRGGNGTLSLMLLTKKKKESSSSRFTKVKFNFNLFHLQEENI